MSLLIRFGIGGAALGFLIGLTGGIAAGVPFLTLLLRIFLCMLIAGGLGAGLYFLVDNFLPEILSPGASAPAPASESQRRVDIVSPADDVQPDFGSREAGIREIDPDEAAESGDSSLIEEVSEESRRSSEENAFTTEAFDSDSFYNDVEKLPDISNMSSHFQSETNEPETSDDSGVSSISSGTGGGGAAKANFDPALMAQALRTALKKDGAS